MSRFRRFVVPVVALVCAVALTGEPAGASIAEEDAFVARINEVRTGHGLAPLAVDPRLSELARSWSARMAASGGVFHNGGLPGQAPGGWTKLGENVGVGPNVDSLHEGFLASPTHLRQIVNPVFQYVGVGVVAVNGELWVTEHFMSSEPAPSAQPRCTKKKCRPVKAKAKAKARPKAKPRRR